jgi:hypothetical protein
MKRNQPQAVKSREPEVTTHHLHLVSHSPHKRVFYFSEAERDIGKGFP